jgi:hypothetical protein
MKNFLFIITFLLITNYLVAAPVGNSASPRYIETGVFLSPGSLVGVRVGYEENFISNARLQQKCNNTPRIDTFKVGSNTAFLVLNIQNRCDIFANIGQSRIKANWRVASSSLLSEIKIESKYDLVWEAGGKAIFFEWGNTSFSMGGRYYKTTPSLSWMTSNGAAIATNDEKINFQQWQVDAGLAHTIDIFVPYIGVKYSNSKAKVKDVVGTVISNDGKSIVAMKNRNKVGMFLGCGITSGNIFALNIEARLIDEEAVTVSGEIRF